MTAPARSKFHQQKLFVSRGLKLTLCLAMTLALPLTLMMTLSNQTTLPAAATGQKQAKARGLEAEISTGYCLKIAAKVDGLVTSTFFDQALVKSAWAPAYETMKKEFADKKTAPTNLVALDRRINECLHSLKTSHCQFVTSNDESFYFLHSLFADISRKFARRPHAWPYPIACTGMTTGGCGFGDDRVRYVLDGSPAEKAGLQIGDKILTVASRPYSGYLDFIDQENKSLAVEIERQGSRSTLTLKPVEKKLYSLYVEATKASKRIIKQGDHRFGYVHLWSGGTAAVNAVTDILGTDSEFRNVDGLIYDLRDGYGGASLEDLDIFYRPAAAFPDFVTKDRTGKSEDERMFFDKPMVALINSGSRSGKELLAYSLKHSGRALLVGENTAGFVVAGSLTPLDDQCALYLAVMDLSLKSVDKNGDTVRLEGVGVAPDMAVPNKSMDQLGYGTQLSAAIEALEKRLASQN